MHMVTMDMGIMDTMVMDIMVTADIMVTGITDIMDTTDIMDIMDTTVMVTMDTIMDEIIVLHENVSYYSCKLPKRGLGVTVL